MSIYIVQKGDTLWKIAKKFNINFEQLKRLNMHLANPDYIVPGMELFLPEDSTQPKKEQPIKERPIQKETPRPQAPVPMPTPVPTPPSQPIERPQMQPMPFPVPIPYPYQMPSTQGNIQMLHNYLQQPPQYHHYFMQQPQMMPQMQPMPFQAQPNPHMVPPFEWMPNKCICQPTPYMHPQSIQAKCEAPFQCEDRLMMQQLYYDKLAHVERMNFTGHCNPLSKQINRSC